MLHFPTSPVLSMGQYSECAMGCNCKLQEGVGPQKPNNLTVKHRAKLTFPEGWELGTEKTSMERVENDGEIKIVDLALPSGDFLLYEKGLLIKSL